MNIATLHARRASLSVELKGIAAGAGADGALTAELETRFSTLETEYRGLEASIARQQFVDDLDRRSAGVAVGGSTGDGRFDEAAAAVTALDVIAAQMGSTSAGAGRAREVSAEIARRSGRNPEGLFFHMAVSGAPVEKRVFTTGLPVGGPGSNLIQTTVSPNLIDRLREKVMVRRLGATVLGGLVGNLAIPRLKASATAMWVAENSPITPSDPQVEQVLFTPKHCGGIVEMSRNMIQQPSLDVARMVENDLAQLLAVALDKAAILGGGTNEPAGLLYTGSGINIVAGGPNGLALSWANVVALIAAVDASNALDGSMAFLTNGKAVKAMRTTAKTVGDTASTFLQSDAATLAGYPLASSLNVPSNIVKGSGTGLSAVIFGDWSQLYIGFWSELDILVNPYESTAYAKGNVQVRAMMTADVKIRQPLSFAAIVDAIAP